MNELTTTKSKEIIIDDELYGLQGMGKELVKARNMAIPRLVIIQALSPQIKPKKVEFIEGASIGDFCNTATGDLFREPITVVPVFFVTNYIEWKKNRGGISNNYGDDPSILEKATRNDKFEFIMPNGNLLQETAQWYCLLKNGAIWDPIFFPLKSTGLKHSRKWMTLVSAEKIRTPKGLWKPPLFWRSWLLTSVEESNEAGEWFAFRPEKRETIIELDPSRELLEQCKEFYSDLQSGKAKGDLESTQDETSSNGGGGGGGAKDPDDKDIPF